MNPEPAPRPGADPAPGRMTSHVQVGTESPVMARPGHPDTGGPGGRKVAEITLVFWVMKICATTVGETGGDLLSMTLKVGYTVSSFILFTLFLIALVAQLRSRTFHPLLYWSVILATSTAGTTISDLMDRTLGLGYAGGAMVLSAGLGIILAAWYLVLGSISVDDVRSPKAETFYWMAILVSNTLGTALGDYLADSSGLGFAASNLLISGAIMLVACAYRFTSVSRTGLFWAAFVLTRPFGATMGDLLTKPPEAGGLGFGTLGSSAGLLAILAGLLAVTAQRTGHLRITKRQGGAL